MKQAGFALILVLVLFSAPFTAQAAGGGFDEFGFNEEARLFNGIADGVDRKWNGKVWGDPTYANDHLVMNWNAEWDRGVAENWKNPPYDAWQMDNWNGQAPGGSGQVWHYKVVWDESCKKRDVPSIPGAYCQWDEFAVIMDHGTSGNEHFWYAHGLPSGLGQ